MGDIYRALDRSTGRPVAIKLITTEHTPFTTRLRNEAQALGEVTHPAVVRLVAYGIAPEHGHYLAMEWLDGVTLWERLQAAPLGLDESLTLVARVAEGLGPAHARGMVHRDIKPLNLLLVGGRPDQVKILDFGIVRFGPGQRITATGAGIGTPEYMAPEQARGDRNIGPQADVFSLGCVLFKCLTGRPAFRGDHPAAVLAKVAMLRRPPRVSELRPDIPRTVDNLVARMMAHRASERPADGTAAAALIRLVQRELVDNAAGAAVSAQPQAWLTRREKQPISVLFADLGPAADRGDAGEDGDGAGEAPVARGPSDTWRVMPAVRRALEPYGARVEPLIEGSIVAMLAGGAALTDLAVRSARSALALRALLPDASIGVATLRAEVGDSAALGSVIDGAVTRVRPGSRTIRIDRRTAALLPERFELRGDDEGALELVGERDRAAGEREPPRPLLGRRTPFVGRKRTLRQLLALYQGCVEDRAAQAVVIVGEAGVGKSRLRAELTALLGDEAAAPALMQARGDPLRASLPFGALGRALLALLAPGEGAADARRAAIARAAGPAGDPEARRVAEFLGEICGVEFPADESPQLRAARQDPALMADQRRRAFEDWVTAACDARPLVLVLDDLQWVDHASIDLVAAALRRARDLPLLVVALARHEAKDRFPNLDKDWDRQEIRLEPLRPGDCFELVRAALGDGVEPELVGRLVARSAGNPFFLEELIRTAAAGETAMLPETVLGSVQLRLGRLAEPARQALRAASVFGVVFRAAGVARLLGRGLDERDVEAPLEELVAEELVHRLPGGGFVFRHDLVREAAYRMLTDADRRIGHRLAGEWLLESGEGDPVVLAEQFAGSGAVEQAVDWFQRAAEEALGDSAVPEAAQAADALRKAATYFRRAAEVCAATYANENAIAFYDRAIALFAPLDGREAARTRLACARLRERAGQRDRAVAELELAEAEAERAGDVATRVEAMLSRADADRRSAGGGALDRAWQLCERARDLAQSAGLRELEAKALAVMAAVLMSQETEDGSQKAVQLARLAVSITSEHGDLAARLWRLGNAFLMRNDLDRAAPFYRDALALAERLGNEGLAADCRANMGMVLFRRWQLDGAIEETQRALALYQRLGHRVRIAEMKLNLGGFWVKRGHFPPAEAFLGEVLAAAAGDWILSSICLDSLSQLERHRGREDVAQRHLTTAAHLCAEVGVPQKHALYLGMLAESCWVTGLAGEAIRHLEHAAEVARAATLSHPLVLAQLGALEQAADLLERFRDADPDPDRRAAARLALARVRWWEGDVKEARAACAAALKVLSPTPLPRYVLPAEVLMACLDGQPAVALAGLAAARVHCSPAIYDEVALDVGTYFADAVATGADADLERYVAMVAATAHRGVRYRIHHLVSRMRRALGDTEGARASAADARADVHALSTQLPEFFAEVFLGNPWVESILAAAPP
jgi:tetratricopeptide (TPR) repeat protein